MLHSHPDFPTNLTLEYQTGHSAPQLVRCFWHSDAVEDLIGAVAVKCVLFLDFLLRLILGNSNSLKK